MFLFIIFGSELSLCGCVLLSLRSLRPSEDFGDSPTLFTVQHLDMGDGRYIELKTVPRELRYVFQFSAVIGNQTY